MSPVRRSWWPLLNPNLLHQTALGLSGEQRDRICKDTNIVFHCAATLRLEANLKDAINMNTSGTKRVLSLCKGMKQLEAFIHLSTAFCYCDQEVLLEKVYDCEHHPEDLIRLSEWMDIKALEKVTADLLKPHPNTYTYSKRLAEILVQNEYPNLPVCIARPSIGKLNTINWTKSELGNWFRVRTVFTKILYYVINHNVERRKHIFDKNAIKLPSAEHSLAWAEIPN